MKRAIDEIGTDMSCLMFLPSRAWASEIDSRSIHSERPCAADCAMTASAINRLFQRLLGKRLQQRGCVLLVFVIA